MIKGNRAAVIILVSVFLLVGCATRGPVVPQVPSVQVTQLDSLLISPEVIKFQAILSINNRMNAGLNLQKVDYGADVNGKQIFTESFAQLKPIVENGQETVTFPFQIAVKDIANRAIDILAQDALNVTFRGQVYLAGDFGFGPVPFRLTKSIPLPRIPDVAIERTEGSPLKAFTVFLKIKNTNGFPMNIKSINSYLDLNGTKYSLLRTEGSTEIKPGSAETVALKMEQTTGKTLSMVLNVARSSSLQFNIGGDISCQTPYGLVYVPLKLFSETQ